MLLQVEFVEEVIDGGVPINGFGTPFTSLGLRNVSTATAGPQVITTIIFTRACLGIIKTRLSSPIYGSVGNRRP